MGEAARGNVAGKGGKAKAEGQEIGFYADFALVSLFGVTARLTGHPHWQKTPEELKAITVPLVQCYLGLPKSVKAKVDRNISPFFLCLGVITTVGTDLAQEVKIRRAEAQAQAREHRKGPGMEQAHRAPGAAPVRPLAQPNGDGAGDSIAPPADLLGVAL